MMDERRNQEIELIEEVGNAIDALSHYDNVRLRRGDLDEDTNAVIVITGQALHRVMIYLTRENTEGEIPRPRWLKEMGG